MMEENRSELLNEEPVENEAYKLHFISGEIEGVESAEDAILELDLPDEVRKPIEDWFKATKKELRAQRTKLI